MSEYIYKLNLPPIQEILLPGKFDQLFKPCSLDTVVWKVDPKTFLRTEYLSLDNYKWIFSLLFYKANGTIGKIHTDAETAWAVNYIVGGTGLMEYYDPVMLGTAEITNVGQWAKNLQPIYKNNNVDPIKIYPMEEGVYLVRTDIPHLAVGYQKRYSLSIRAGIGQNSLPWETVVESFKKYMVP